MFIGYARVSTQEQNLDLQLDALNGLKCDKVFTDKTSGGKVEREGLQQALEFARPGDTIVVWKLDRLGRSLQHLVETVNALHARGVGFKSLKENIDTTSATGKLVFHIFAALAEFERDLIRERTRAGLAAAKARGRQGGRKPKMDAAKTSMAKELLKKHSPAEVCRTLGISDSTLRRHVQRES